MIERSQRRNLLAPSTARLKPPAVILALHRLSIEPPSRQRNPPMRAQIAHRKQRPIALAPQQHRNPQQHRHRSLTPAQRIRTQRRIPIPKHHLRRRPAHSQLHQALLHCRRHGLHLCHLRQSTRPPQIRVPQPALSEVEWVSPWRHGLAESPTSHAYTYPNACRNTIPPALHAPHHPPALDRLLRQLHPLHSSTPRRRRLRPRRSSPRDAPPPRLHHPLRQRHPLPREGASPLLVHGRNHAPLPALRRNLTPSPRRRRAHPSRALHPRPRPHPRSLRPPPLPQP